MINNVITKQDSERYKEFHSRADKFFDKTICTEKLQDHLDYIPGTHKISFYEERLSQAQDICIETFSERDYEESIIERLTISNTRNNVLITIGALGSGKSTCVSEISRIINQKLSEELADNSEFKGKIFRPLVVPCIHMTSADSELELLKILLTSVLDRIVKIWLNDYQVNDDITRALLQCLILIDGVRTWAFTNPLHNFPKASISSPLADLPPQDILSLEPGSDSFNEKISSLRPLTIKIQDYYLELINTIDSATNAVSCALGLLSSLTNNVLIPKVVIVDNLDQLPTKTIQSIVSSLYSISAVNLDVKFFIPLRPSSLGINRYTQNITYIYHKGPCTFYLIYHRLEKYILSKSKKYLKTQKKDLNSPHCKTDIEVSALISSAYIYACLMLVGSHKNLGNPEKVIQEVASQVHPEHQDIIETIDLRPGTVKTVSEMIDAVVGLSGRYAIAQVSQFIADLYNSPDLLIRIHRQKESGKTVAVTYKRLISTLFFSTGGKLTLGRYLNLFTPVESNNNPRRPSLVKLRILSHIQDAYSDHSMTIGALVRSLASYGVPTNIVIRSLSTLNDERRRLVWFSSNQAVQGTDYEDSECAVVSEQGMRYLFGLIQTFDYLWVCSSLIRGQLEDDPVFPSKFSKYIALIRELLEIELKQSAFFVCGDQESVAPVGSPQEYITLRLLLRSIPQAVQSSSIAFAVTQPRTKYTETLASYIAVAVQLLRQAMIEYKYCFGGPHYVDVYRSEMETSIKALQHLIQSRGENLQDSDRNIIEDGIESLIYEIDSYDRFEAFLRERPASPDLDLIEETAKIGRVVLPEKKIGQIDKLELSNAEKNELKRRQEKLSETLRSRIPHFQELSATLRSIIDQLAICIKTSEQMGVATGRTTYEWLKKEQDWWKDSLNKLESTSYSVGGQKLSFNDADEAKNQFNARIQLIGTLCTELDANPPLNIRRALWA